MPDSLTRVERAIVVEALRRYAKVKKNKPTGKGDQRLLHAKRKAEYTEINDLATAFQEGRR
jgi:hypothetical protein